MNATKTAYELGYEDGAAAYRESGSTVAPVDGWDSDLINAVGLTKICEMFGLDEATEKGDWSEAGLAALKEYCRGCQEGCEAATKTTGVEVYSVKPSHGGFGQFDRSSESQSFPGWDSVSDYTGWVLEENTDLELLTDDEVKHVDGNLHNQNGGTVIGFRSEDGSVSYEVVYVITK